jgi:retron-type reverse transcriptase
MSHLLQPTQTGFLKGRHILEAFLYAQEVIQSATKQNKEITVLKADIYKAFDSLNWKFLLKYLAARGFDDKWMS